MSQSSTSSSGSGHEPGPNRVHSIRLVVVMVLVVLLGSEVVARGLAQALPPYEGWGVRDFEWQASRMGVRSATEETCIAFVGSSSVGAAVDPETLTAELGHDHFYLAWLAGATARLVELWAREIVIPTFSPEFVVIGLTSRDLNDSWGGLDSLIDAYLSSSARERRIGESSISTEIEAVAARHSALFAIRPYLRNPGELVARLSGRIPTMAPEYGQHLGFRDALYEEEAADQLAQVRSYVKEFSVGGEETVALESTIEHLRSQGIAVALVDLPVLEDKWSSLHERGTEDLESYRATLRGVAERHDVPLFSYAGMVDDAGMFGDWIHLNGDGAIHLTERLGDDVTSWMGNSGRVCDSGASRLAPGFSTPAPSPVGHP